MTPKQVEYIGSCRRELHADTRADKAELLGAYRDMLAAAKAYQGLSVCYRLGKRPSEKLFKRLEKAKKALEENS